MPEEKNIIEKFDKKFKDKWWDEVCFEMEWGNGQKHQRTIRIEVHQFLLTELQALKEECVKFSSEVIDQHDDDNEYISKKDLLEAFKKFGI